MNSSSSMTSNIRDYIKGLVVSSQRVIEKGKRANLGEIRVRTDGSRWRKIQGGWEPVREGVRQPKTQESSNSRSPKDQSKIRDFVRREGSILNMQYGDRYGMAKKGQGEFSFVHRNGKVMHSKPNETKEEFQQRIYNIVKDIPEEQRKANYDKETAEKIGLDSKDVRESGLSISNPTLEELADFAREAKTSDLKRHADGGDKNMREAATRELLMREQEKKKIEEEVNATEKTNNPFDSNYSTDNDISRSGSSNSNNNPANSNDTANQRPTRSALARFDAAVHEGTLGEQSEKDLRENYDELRDEYEKESQKKNPDKNLLDALYKRGKLIRSTVAAKPENKKKIAEKRKNRQSEKEASLNELAQKVDKEVREKVTGEKSNTRRITYNGREYDEYTDRKTEVGDIRDGVGSIITTVGGRQFDLEFKKTGGAFVVKMPGRSSANPYNESVNKYLEKEGVKLPKKDGEQWVALPSKIKPESLRSGVDKALSGIAFIRPTQEMRDKHVDTEKVDKMGEEKFRSMYGDMLDAQQKIESRESRVNNLKYGTAPVQGGAKEAEVELKRAQAEYEKNLEDFTKKTGLTLEQARQHLKNLNEKQPTATSKYDSSPKSEEEYRGTHRIPGREKRYLGD